MEININMKHSLSILLLAIFSFVVHAEDYKINVISDSQRNFILYPTETGVFLRLDTRNGVIDGIVPSDQKKNKRINAIPLTEQAEAGRFILYPTDRFLTWILLDSKTGEMWNVILNSKNNNYINKIKEFE